MQDFWTINSITTIFCHVLFELPLPYLLPSFYPTYEPPLTVPKSMDSVLYTLSIITINFHYQYYIIICYHKNLVSLLFPYHHYSQYIPIPKNHVSISPEFLLPASKLSTTRHLTSYGHPSRPIKSAMVFLRGATSAHIESGSDGVSLSWQSKGHTPPQEKRFY